MRKSLKAANSQKKLQERISETQKNFNMKSPKYAKLASYM
jgi:hypothetical protein